MNPVAVIGHVFLNFLAGIGDLALFAGRAIVQGVSGPFYPRMILRQMIDIGYYSLPVVGLTAIFTGMVLALQSHTGFSRFEAQSAVATIVVLSMTRELGPVLAGLMVAGRVGASMAAELGTMRVTEQIDALEASAVDSFRYLVVTRTLACIIALPILTTLMNFSGMLGGFIAEASATGMSLSLYFTRAFSIVSMTDYVPATLKTMVFGFIIATVSSYLGFTTSSGTEGVGRASTRAVVLSSILIIVSNVILVRLIFFIFPEAAGG